jgi:alkylation response protein AidB-like acyl-CoA dehydrogenase
MTRQCRPLHQCNILSKMTCVVKFTAQYADSTHENLDAKRSMIPDAQPQSDVENYAMLRDAGFFGLSVPKEYGGMEAGIMGWAVAAEELAQGCAATALSFNMHVMNTGIIFEDPGVPVSARRRMAELVIDEGKLTCGLGSEPGSSSHLGGSFQMMTKAKRVPGGYRLYGQKRFAE